MDSASRSTDRCQRRNSKRGSRDCHRSKRNTKEKSRSCARGPKKASAKCESKKRGQGKHRSRTCTKSRPKNSRQKKHRSTTGKKCGSKNQHGKRHRSRTGTKCESKKRRHQKHRSSTGSKCGSKKSHGKKHRSRNASKCGSKKRQQRKHRSRSGKKCKKVRKSRSKSRSRSRSRSCHKKKSKSPAKKRVKDVCCDDSKKDDTQLGGSCGSQLIKDDPTPDDEKAVAEELVEETESKAGGRKGSGTGAGNRPVLPKSWTGNLKSVNSTTATDAQEEIRNRNQFLPQSRDQSRRSLGTRAFGQKGPHRTIGTSKPKPKSQGCCGSRSKSSGVVKRKQHVPRKSKTTAYAVFFQKYFADKKRKNPRMMARDIARDALKAWKKLSKTQKEKYTPAQKKDSKKK